MPVPTFRTLPTRVATMPTKLVRIRTHFFRGMILIFVGIAFVTFDSTSASAGTATPRIFVGVASLGVNNLYVSENGGTSCG